MSREYLTIRDGGYFDAYSVDSVSKISIFKGSHGLPFYVRIWYGGRDTEYKFDKYSDAVKNYVKILVSLRDTEVLNEFLGTLDLRVELWKGVGGLHTIVRKWVVDGEVVYSDVVSKRHAYGTRFEKEEAERMAKKIIEDHYNKKEPDEYGEEMIDVFEAKGKGS